ncbi:hypothetical protein EV182_007034 [Spiromyces aspiralis]|uniref:Uncharacterized protein n=1 Tax=Spiromyces aspiralis TaxID=68401 RepID=A0ACC1H9A1_9FUNG|nr:hypothetical protein EV182_007034 [Spiromyces aspiralis]
MDSYSSDIISRPSHFGKTMFLNMARDFLNIAETDEELAERKRIFKSMNIHKVDPTFVDEHCGRYPAELNDSRDRLKQMKSNMCNSADDSVAIMRELVDYLSEYYNAQCIVLVDEFDTPIMEAYDRTHDRVKRYMRRLLLPLAKDNTRVRKFIMVGIDPVNLDTFGPGMNNCR